MACDIRLIGIGTGNPEHITLAAQKFIETSDVILIPKKTGKGKEHLIDLRLFILENLLKKKPAMIHQFEMPTRDPAIKNYSDRVEAWHVEIAGRWLQAINFQKEKKGKKNLKIALMIWGDPSLYDSAIRIFSIIKKKDNKSNLTVIPGITAIQVLTAAHKITLNSIGGDILITTGRKLREDDFFNSQESLVVMLDEQCSFNQPLLREYFIYWGAYLGMENQILVSGLVKEVGEEIIHKRALARSKYGWIMDTYLLRKTD